MTDVINLNKARKARDKRAAKAVAAENRVRFGQAKPARERDAQAAERTKQDLDGKKLD